MKVKIFIDGQNFYRSLQRIESGVRLDYDALAQWIANAVGGEFNGAHYYVGVIENLPPPVISFLNGLEKRRGYFVHTSKRVVRSMRCPKCHEIYDFSIEKGIDTRLSVDMLRFAATKACDVIVLLSGDEDFVPVIQAVNTLGIQTWVATWSNELSANLRANAFGHLALTECLETCRIIYDKE